MLLDDVLPVYDVRSRHQTIVRASPERVYAALWSANLAPPLVRLLLGARALPGALAASLARPREAPRLLRPRAKRTVTLRDVIDRGFTLVAEDPPREVVLGLVGAFWRLRGGVRHADADSLRQSPPRGTARAAWSFWVTQRTDGSCLLSTETRVQCADPASRRRFKLYWVVVRPGSGLIRRLMLRAIRRAAER
jgi:hypothetical protein